MFACFKFFDASVQIECRSRIRRNDDAIRNFSVLFLPRGLDFAIDALLTALGVIHMTADNGSNTEMIFAVDGDAKHAREEPFHHRAFGIMV